MSANAPLLLWFRQDLRIRDNAAFAAILESGRPVLPVFVWDPDAEKGWEPGAAARVFLRHALDALARDLGEHGLPLVVRRGSSGEVLRDLLGRSGAAGVHWNRRYEPAAIERDAAIKRSLREEGFEGESHNSSLLFEPWEVATGGNRPYQVFTPFWRNTGAREKEAPVEVDLRRLRRPESFPEPGSPDDLGLLPSHAWGEKVAGHWEIGEGAARRRLDGFLADGVRSYPKNRNLPAVDGTSRLSPYLHWGLIGPRQVWRRAVEEGVDQSAGGRAFLSEIGWREFAYHVLYHFPHTPEAPLREKFKDFPWREDEEFLRRWRRGETGYPIVDAGMRQLWEEGWMHNRVRMIVGSLLVKHLLQPWSHGARWFWDCLVDADLASNTLGWQWSGGCGADAAPYFRVFNPMTQGEKFDPGGDYVRHYVPELRGLPSGVIHRPWEAGEGTLADAGVRLGRDYPYPVVDHKEGRERALAAFGEVKG